MCIHDDLNETSTINKHLRTNRTLRDELRTILNLDAFLTNCLLCLNIIYLIVNYDGADSALYTI